MATKSTNNELRKLRAELAALEADNERLKQQLQGKPGFSKGLLRKSSVLVLTVIAVCLVLLGNLFFWAGNTVVKTDRYVDAVTPIIAQPSVQTAIATYTTDQLFDTIAVESYVQEVLPPRAAFLAPQFTQQLQTQTQNVLRTAVASDRFQITWQEVQRSQHERLIDAVTNYEGDGSISLNDVYGRLSQRLQETSLAFLADKQLPSNVGNITIVDAPWLPTAHTVVTNIDTWRTLTLLLLVASVAAAMWLSRNRRQTLYLFSLGVFVAMLATLISLRVTQEAVAGRVDATYAQAVRDSYAIITQSLVLQSWLIAIFAGVIAAIAWISGASRGAEMVKRRLVVAASGAVHQQLFGSSKHPALLWAQRNKAILQWSVVGLLTIVLLTVRLTIASLAWYIAGLLLCILLIEIIAAPPKKVRRKKQ